MGLIKANSSAAAVPFSMKDVEDVARVTILRARQQADQLLAGAMKEGEDLKRQMAEEGQSAGHKAGLEKGTDEGRKACKEQALAEQREELANVVKALTMAVADQDQARRKLESEALREVIDLAIAIARKVTKRQSEIDPAVLGANVADAMKLVVHAHDLRIAVNPKQKAMLAEVLPALQMQWPALEHVELVEEAELALGGCRIYSRQGQVDADIDEQLNRVVADLLPSQRA